MTEIFAQMPASAVLISACVIALWLISIPIRNVSIIDIFWAPGFAVVAIATWVRTAEVGLPGQLLLVMTVAWALRLAIYLAVRNLGHGEDPRYARFRASAENRGANYVIHSLWSVFLLQGVLILVVSMPLQVGISAPAGAAAGWLTVLGAALWTTGFLFEAIGDWQLRRFKDDASNRGKVLDTGLWRYTRHPNYFGNACIWWGLYLIACDVPNGAWTIVSPGLMTWLLLKVSGVSLLEKSLGNTKPGYAEYVRRTSAFFPRPPRD